MGKKDAHEMSVGAKIEVSYKGAQPITVKPTIMVGRQQSPSSRVKLPGPQEAYLTLESLQAAAKTVVLVYEGPESAVEKKPEEKLPSVIAEVSIKPGMTVLWLGAFLILLGGCIAIPRRWKK
jgi:hypothetical protein